MGAFMAQDLLLFVLFFDLMLVPFYFRLVPGTFAAGRGGRGDNEDDRPQAGRLAADAGRRDRDRDPLLRLGRQVSFSIPCCAEPAGTGSQRWIFWFFAAAFLVKMPAFPMHGWMPDAYRGGPAAAPVRVLGGAVQGRRLWLPADRAAVVPRRHHPVPGGVCDRARVDPLRLGDGVHADQRAADRRLFVGRPAGIHQPRASSAPAPGRRRQRGAPDGQPRPRGRVHIHRDRRPLRPHTDRGPDQDGAERCGHRSWRACS